MGDGRRKYSNSKDKWYKRLKNDYYISFEALVDYNQDSVSNGLRNYWIGRDYVSKFSWCFFLNCVLMYCVELYATSNAVLLRYTYSSFYSKMILALWLTWAAVPPSSKYILETPMVLDNMSIICGTSESWYNIMLITSYVLFNVQKYYSGTRHYGLEIGDTANGPWSKIAPNGALHDPRLKTNVPLTVITPSGNGIPSGRVSYLLVL